MKNSILSQVVHKIYLRDDPQGPIVETITLRLWHWGAFLAFVIFCAWLTACTPTRPVFGGHPSPDYFSIQATYHRMTGNKDSCREWISMDKREAFIGILWASGEPEKWYKGEVIDIVKKNCLAINTQIGRRVICYDSTGKEFAPPSQYYDIRELPNPFVQSTTMNP